MAIDTNLNEFCFECFGEHGMVRKMQKLKMVKKPLMKDPEGELSDWAKRQLAIARATPDSEAISHEELKKKLFKK